MATVCPRLKSQLTTERIDCLNAGLQVLCAEEGCAIINNDDTFKLSNGDINDAYLLKDNTHLTYAGTNRLAKNLGLQPKAGFEKDICHRKTTNKLKPMPSDGKHFIKNSRDKPVNANRNAHHRHQPERPRDRDRKGAGAVGGERDGAADWQAAPRPSRQAHVPTGWQTVPGNTR